MFTIFFSKLNKNLSDVAGGKGASLGEMMNVNIPIPNGFVVLSGAFQTFLGFNELNVEIDTILESVNHKDTNTINNASEKIQALILNAKFPENLKQEVEENFQKLDCEFVAVRSSATAEDGKDHAWAGQLNSYLNTKQEGLLENIKKCFASLFTPRAIFYRFEKELHKTKISVAVVIQKMIQSEVSGVAFSVHPITEDRNQILIEAGYGLGEAIVSGSITPDSYVIHKNDLEIIDKNVHTQTKGIYKGKIGDEWLEIVSKKQDLQKLSDEQIVELAKLVVQIENHYGFPCDIEWGLENDKFYILQSRPITTLLGSVFQRKDEGGQIKEGDYDFLWRVFTWFPFCYMLWESGYQKGDFIFTYEEGEYFAFVSKKERERLSKKTIKIYTKHGCQKFYLKSKKISDKAREEFEKLGKLDLSNLSNIKLASKFLKMRNEALKLLKVYFLLEYHSMDLVAEKILEEGNEEIKSSAQFLGEFKLEMRKVWGDLLEDNGLLPRFLGEAGKRLNIGKKADLFTIQELCNALKGLQNDFSLDRNKGYVWGQKIGGVKTGNEAVEIIRQLWKKDKKFETLSGQIAQKGFYKGKVKKIDYGDYDGEGYLSRKIDAMEKGDVLVVGSTSPEFIIACKKAGAIITDEGGVISHAAIISRELKIPCIIGTKYGTAILNDGDLVEVDANNGIIRIIK